MSIVGWWGLDIKYSNLSKSEFEKTYFLIKEQE